MKHLVLPITLLLSCAVAQSADTVGLVKLKNQNPTDETAQAAVSLKTEQRPNLAALFDQDFIPSLVTKYKIIKEMQQNINQNNTDYSATFARWECNNFKQFKDVYEETIIAEIKSWHKMGANLNGLALSGQTALEIAVKTGSPNIITTLVELGADVNPVFMKGTLFAEDRSGRKIKSLVKTHALLEAIKTLPAEQKKATNEKAEQLRKEQEQAAKERKEREEAELKKQQEKEDEQNRKYNEERTQHLNRLNELQQKLLNPTNKQPPTYY